MAKSLGRRVLFSGYAKLPTGITATELYKVIGLVILVDLDTETIVEADCTLATQVARKHVAETMAGQSLKNGPEPIVRLIDQVYQGSAKKAIITAFRISYDKYRSFKEGALPAMFD
ncbi:MAG TPA: DUF3870 domain-containing protein [Selenomonadales bacterium]|nr:DUF3870 domain-containing protein [Selenomonadales bacterium]